MRLQIVICLIIAVGFCSAEHCNICMPSGYACQSESTFRVCSAGKAVGGTMTCPNGLNCTEAPQICGLGLPACVEKCGKCNEEMSIACLGANRFSLCLGTPQPSTLEGECPMGTVCNNMYEGDFCVPYTAGLMEPSCLPNKPDSPVPTTTTPPPKTQRPFHSYTTPVPQPPPMQETTFVYQYHTPAPTPAPTTPPPPTPPPANLTPQQQCASRSRPGRYSIDTVRCRSYLYCYVQGGSLTGQELKCPGTTVFNPSIQKCVSADTYSCAAGAAGGMQNMM